MVISLMSQLLKFRFRIFVTREEALTNAQTALGAVLDRYEEQGRDLPGHFH